MTTKSFIEKETTPKKRADGKVLDCKTCGLYEHCDSPKMEPYGNFEKSIMLIGEAPGEEEDKKDTPFVGKTGRMLGRYLKSVGIDIFEDCICLNAVRCRPEGNRTPTAKEIDCCRRLVMEAVSEYQPKAIVLLGGSALQSVIGDRWKRDLGGITKWRGFCIPDQDLKSWVCPTFHPSYVARDDDGAVETVWEQDLKQIVETVDIPFPRNRIPDIIEIDDLSMLDNLNEKVIAFDIETTGLKPHAAGHRIVCAAVATSWNRVFTFMMPDKPKDRRPFLNLLINPEIGKMAHNIKFEMAWCQARLRTEVVNWEWDSMLAAHIIDNRTGITSLKFQTYVNFGVIDYSSDVYPFLRGTDWKNSNSHNKIMELVNDEHIKTKDHYARMQYIPGDGKRKLLEYCAYDAIYEYRLAMQQQKQMNYSFLPF